MSGAAPGRKGRQGRKVFTVMVVVMVNESIGRDNSQCLFGFVIGLVILVWGVWLLSRLLSSSSSDSYFKPS